MKCRHSRKLADAQHEAAHVVVGVALGLRLHRASLVGEAADEHAYALFQSGPREAELMMFAAGVAWERRCGDLEHAQGDLKWLRRLRVRGRGRLVALERAAWAVLMSRAGLHARVARALLDGPITARDVARMIRGERVDLG